MTILIKNCHESARKRLTLPALPAMLKALGG